jgi:hypothetical protein
LKTPPKLAIKIQSVKILEKWAAHRNKRPKSISPPRFYHSRTFSLTFQNIMLYIDWVGLKNKK